jgi:anti-sigma factor RsiW
MADAAPQVPPLNDDDRDNLVAYLDGELDEAATAAVEAKLILDPAQRAEATMLRKTWDLLDHLPRPQPSGSFTNRTLERISAYRTSPLQARYRLLRGPWALGVGWAAAVLLATAAGFAGSRFLPHHLPASDPNKNVQLEGEQELIRDLRVIQNKRLYEHVDNIEFARMLADPDDPDLFGDDNQGS